MQNCFREYPEIYGSELDSDADDDEDDIPADAAPVPAAAETASSEVAPPASEASKTKEQGNGLVPEAYRSSGEKQSKPTPTADKESAQLVPVIAHDASGDNAEKN